jgi:hypothetical protein
VEAKLEAEQDKAAALGKEARRDREALKRALADARRVEADADVRTVTASVSDADLFVTFLVELLVGTPRMTTGKSSSLRERAHTPSLDARQRSLLW